MAWINDDGLRVRFASEEAADTPIGEYGNFDPGSIHLVQLEINPTVLNAVATNTYTSVRFPGANDQTCFIAKAEVHVEEAFDSAGDAFTLTIGFSNVDGTVYDADGIDVAIAQTAMDAVGDVVTCDGAKVKTRLDNTQPLYLTTAVGGAVPTAGKGWVKVWYYLTNE
jgi:predicted homoserine dehydrogenase-like protein